MLNSALGETAAAPWARTVGTCELRVWAPTSHERLARTFRRVGLVTPPPPAGATSIVLVHEGWVYDEALIRALAQRPGSALVDAAGRVAAVHVAAVLADAASASLVPQPLPQPELVFAVTVGGYAARRALEGVFVLAFKIHGQAWRPFDSFVRPITARRNPNLILLTLATIAGRPDVGLGLVAVWTAASLVVHAAQIVQAFAAPRATVVSWLSR